MIATLKRAFTLLELIFVIVILGIVASIGSSVIVQVYESYINQKAVHNAALKTELAINQLANRLSYRIDTSLITRMDATGGAVGTMIALKDINIATDDRTDFHHLEWIGYDNDSLSATNTPGWSGFLDLATAANEKVISTGSNFEKTSAIIGNLNGGSPALYFVGSQAYKIDGAGVETYANATCLHAITGNGCIFPVNLNATSEITFSSGSGDYVPGSMQYSEYYQLAYSAYAVVLENRHEILGTPVWDLRLYYNYQPWEGETYLTASSSILLRNVNIFRFKSESGNSLRIKLCSIEQISETEKISLCKEKAVIR